MQNMDFYTGQPGAQIAHPQFVTKDPEYFARMAVNQHKDKEKTQNRAARTLSIVLGLCILSFTSGLIVGIKFTGSRDSEIVDEATRQAVNNLGSNLETKVNTMLQDPETPAASGQVTTAAPAQEQSSSTTAAQPNAAASTITEEQPKEPVTRTFPKEEFPWVIKVGELFSADQAKKVADYLSSRGHTVILTRTETLYRVYLGPYKSRSTADSNISRINNYTDNTYFNTISVVKR